MIKTTRAQSIRRRLLLCVPTLVALLANMGVSVAAHVAPVMTASVIVSPTSLTRVAFELDFGEATDGFFPEEVVCTACTVDTSSISSIGAPPGRAFKFDVLPTLGSQHDFSVSTGAGVITYQSDATPNLVPSNIATINYDPTNAAVLITTASASTAAANVVFTVTFNKPMYTPSVTLDDLIFTCDSSTASPCLINAASSFAKISDTVYEYTVSTAGLTNGRLRAEVLAGAATDQVNPDSAGAPTANGNANAISNNAIVFFGTCPSLTLGGLFAASQCGGTLLVVRACSFSPLLANLNR